MASRVSVKLEEGDFKGAIRLACSKDTLADLSDTTFDVLLQKYPPLCPNSIIPARSATLSAPIVVSEKEVTHAIQSFPNGSTGGLDGLKGGLVRETRLKPQHLKDMISPSANGGRQVLLSALTPFIRLVLEGSMPASVCPFSFGTNLTALQSKDGGVQPIAAGCTLHHLVAKVAEEMGILLAPRQLGYGVKKGVEAAVHATSLYLRNLDSDNASLKLDFRNAFNSVHT